MSTKIYMETAQRMATSSPDPSTKVGCVLVKPSLGLPLLSAKMAIAVGFNTMVPGSDFTRYEDRPYKYSRTVHAEMMALLDAGNKAEGCDLYTTHFPCEHCAVHISMAGIRKVYTPEIEADYAYRWSESIKRSGEILAEGGVVVHTVREW